MTTPTTTPAGADGAKTQRRLLPYYTALLLLLTTFSTLIPVNSRAVNISNTWILPEEGFPVFYRYFRDRISWYEADAVCQFHHANLVTVDTTAQYDATRAYLKELDIVNNVWIGLIKSKPDGDFTWTERREYRPLTHEGFWEEAVSHSGTPLCVATDPAADFRWRGHHCGGPEVASFICELPVPSWASQPEGCMLTSLPSLTVLYLPEQAAVELTSDCGLGGTKSIVCKGQADRDEMIRQLSCGITPEDFDEKGGVSKSPNSIQVTTDSESMSQATTSGSGDVTSQSNRVGGGEATKTWLWSSNTVDVEGYDVPTRHRRETDNTDLPATLSTLHASTVPGTSKLNEDFEQTTRASAEETDKIIDEQLKSVLYAENVESIKQMDDAKSILYAENVEQVKTMEDSDKPGVVSDEHIRAVIKGVEATTKTELIDDGGVKVTESQSLKSDLPHATVDLTKTIIGAGQNIFPDSGKSIAENEVKSVLKEHTGRNAESLNPAELITSPSDNKAVLKTTKTLDPATGNDNFFADVPQMDQSGLTVESSTSNGVETPTSVSNLVQDGVTSNAQRNRDTGNAQESHPTVADVTENSTPIADVPRYANGEPEFPSAINQGQLFGLGAENGSHYDIDDNETTSDATADASVPLSTHSGEEKREKIASIMPAGIEEPQKTPPPPAPASTTSSRLDKGAVESTPGSTENIKLLELDTDFTATKKHNASKFIEIDDSFTIGEPHDHKIIEINIIDRKSKSPMPSRLVITTKVNKPPLPYQTYTSSVKKDGKNLAQQPAMSSPIKIMAFNETFTELTNETTVQDVIVIDPKMHDLNVNFPKNNDSETIPISGGKNAPVTPEIAIPEKIKEQEMRAQKVQEDNIRREFFPVQMMPDAPVTNDEFAGANINDGDNLDEAVKNEDSTELNSEVPPRPNRGRLLTRSPHHSYYPYFFSRVLG